MIRFPLLFSLLLTCSIWAQEPGASVSNVSDAAASAVAPSAPVASEVDTDAAKAKTDPAEAKPTSDPAPKPTANPSSETSKDEDGDPDGSEAASNKEAFSIGGFNPQESQELLNAKFDVANGYLAKVFFFDISGGRSGLEGGFPFIVALLGIGGIIFTFMFGMINIRLFFHGIACVRGKYDDPDDDGEISHFAALTSALSATVGLGNIAGVAVAIAAGGPGAVFWMWIVAFFGMTMKFCSCTLAQIYRRVDPKDGHVLGGPMVYLDKGIREQWGAIGWPIGKIFGIVFAILTVLASFGGGNMFQGNMTYQITESVLGFESDWAPWVFGGVLALLVAVVIIGGIRRIGEVTSKLVPAMCLFYCGVCLFIIFSNMGKVPAMFGSILESAFTPNAALGGFIGVLLQGMKRAAFSNEAGLGSAAIAHSAAKTKEPVREGVVAMLGPFIDTILVCTMTALAILITGVHEGISSANWIEGSIMTATAFGSLGSWAQYLLIAAVVIFAFSTMISWSYYGERSAEYLLGRWAIVPYRIIFSLLVVLGPVASIGAVLDFSDMMILAMGFPNIIGMLILSPIVLKHTRSYLSRLWDGEMDPRNQHRAAPVAAQPPTGPAASLAAQRETKATDSDGPIFMTPPKD